MIGQTTVYERLDKLPTDPLVLSGSLDKAYGDLLALYGHTQGNEHLLIGKGGLDPFGWVPYE